MWLTQAALENTLNAVWFHVANEVSNGHQYAFGAKLKAMGKLPGVADFVFLAPHKGGALELKYAKGKLSEPQETFRDWCKSKDVVYGVARTLDEAINWIKENGFTCESLD